PLFILVIATFTPPFQVVLVTALQAHPDVGLDQYLLGPHLPFAAPAFLIFLARPYILALPTELLEAARRDGAGELTIFRVNRYADADAALAVMSILVFNAGWNEYLWSCRSWWCSCSCSGSSSKASWPAHSSLEHFNLQTRRPATGWLLHLAVARSPGGSRTTR